MQALPELRHVLPADRCCNCDARAQLSAVAMDFPLTTEGFPDAERWGLVVRAPFCPLCLPSSRRRPLRFSEQFLLGFLISVLVLVVVGQFALEARAVDPLLKLGVALAIGFGAAFGVPRLMPRNRGQSSFWRPLRVQASRADAAQGVLRTLTFEFTSRSYAGAFERANAAALARGALKFRILD